MFPPDGVVVSRDIANHGSDVDFFVQEVDVEHPESKNKDLPFQLNAYKCYKIYLHKTANL